MTTIVKQPSYTLTTSENIDWQPNIFDLTLFQDRKALEELYTNGVVKHVLDDYLEQLRELFTIQNPELSMTPYLKEGFKTYIEELEKTTPLWQQGKWIYYPWRSTITHILDKDSFYTVRTARNKYLITDNEQQKLNTSTIGIAGLSIGNSVALALTLVGIGCHIKLADHDVLALSNLNRIRDGIHSMGSLKTHITAQAMYELNPYLSIEIFSEGISKDDMERFFLNPTLNIIIDEIDDLSLKYSIREMAQKYEIPLVSAIDVEDRGLVDVERYDLDENIEFFNGRLGIVNKEMLTNLDKKTTGALISKHVGDEHESERMKKSLRELGKTLVSWPQLGSTALLNGAAVAYTVRELLLNHPLTNKRSIIAFDELIT